jgi:hypothetical protein
MMPTTKMLASTLAVAALAATWVHAQNTTNFATPLPKSAPTGPAPRLPSGKPDFTGVWQRAYVPDMSRNGRGQLGFSVAPFAPDDSPARRAELRKEGNYGELPFTPAGLEDWKTYDPANGEYTASCMPFGLSRSMNSPDPMQVMQNDRYLTLLFEQNTWFHIIYTDGRDHPKTVEPTWFGHSVGKWDGDTLIVDTVGFNGYTRLDTVGHPHSHALHMIETMRRTDAGHIAYTVTIDDPKAYTRPWKNERTFTLMDTDLIEYSCEENNRGLREGRIKPWTPPEKSRYE